ncbi:HsdR family type I site-specific deoxyribonuclease [Pontibacillus yanchengensis]|uniref:HsdR family type I site-specific deoxyribonuclease n=2 Tax=Pontibacillus yanchengensis TaxID=462910 RepID=A0ACC7VIX1_9BACI|nr:type I restriction endonuclease subunit R [Pontibacillus yanchengensis]MYL35561.1 HsdR family type I site-specific deoxyribonuclease [Pontibacillus yanchengensis]MYL54637.1 HsdR family type I site-specific deoxyribonuclease [Pontibacillus yanchengensis]
MSAPMSEDKLVQETTANYFQDALNWNSVFAYNTEVMGINGTLGRTSEKEVVLVRYLRQALKTLNPGIPDEAYEDAIHQITESNVSKSMLQINREKYLLFKNGVQVSYRNNKGIIEKKRLRVFNFEDPSANHFLVVREMWVQGRLYRRRPDIIGFVNGIPLLFIELKNVHRDIREAYEGNLSDYKDTVPHLFDHNAFVFLSNGDEAKVGSISSKYEHFNEWKRLSEDDKGIVDLETLLKGTCTKENFMDLFENFILFDDSSGKLIKIVARNHQFLGVNLVVDAVRNRENLDGKLGVFWHTQGSGKSYSMVFFTEKVHRKIQGNFTFLIVTDREDLDSQIYKTFAGTGAVSDEGSRAGSGKHLEQLLCSDHEYVFSMIHKFNQEIDPSNPYSKRNDIIVISDEAHRTQYGRLALNMRNALPNAHYIGFTGTPLFKDDQITKRLFGDYVSTYDFQKAVDDNATVPLFYDNRGEKLNLSTKDINQKIAEKIEETELDQDQQARLEKELAREYHILTAEKRLDAIAKDFVEHYTTRWETGKSMLVCLDKITVVRLYNLILKYWKEKIQEIERTVGSVEDEQEETFIKRKLQWLKETEMAVVVSEEQGEVQKFKKWDLDIIPHREKMKNGYETSDGRRIDLDTAFKNQDHPLRVAIVCAMWLTGFDVPSLSTLYLDKPLRAHTLMQTIARANRVNEGKNNGLIVDYCGILKNLREALATFATGQEGNNDGNDPVKPDEELLEDLKETIEATKTYLLTRGFSLDSMLDKKGFELIASINKAKEAINENEETRKRYEIFARQVFKKFKACINIKEVNKFRPDYNNIDIIYKKLQDDKEKADISEVLREMHAIVDEAIETSVIDEKEDSRLYDISNIDFERLKEEFKKSPAKNTTVHNLNEVVEKRLSQMIKKNPLRVDYYQKYQKIIEEYNKEKDRTTIEETFEQILRFVKNLDEEEKRGVREGLNEEKLALYDLLISGKKLSKKEREKIKEVGKELLEALKSEKLNMSNWREKESTKADIKTFIYNYLYDENTGLPIEQYTPEDVEFKANIVFEHIFNQYSSSTENVYAS